ncbi:hypothetical protein ABZP36_005672 [Zizania latifolia]
MPASSAWTPLLGLELLEKEEEVEVLGAETEALAAEVRELGRGVVQAEEAVVVTLGDRVQDVLCLAIVDLYTRMK